MGTGHDIFFNISKICLKTAHILPLERQFYPEKTTSKGFFTIFFCILQELHEFLRGQNLLKTLQTPEKI
jgi:hypothetical protein